jgi:hypothetical protein
MDHKILTPEKKSTPMNHPHNLRSISNSKSSANKTLNLKNKVENS